MFLPHPRVKVNTAGSLRDREVACSASDRQGSNFESCVWRTVSSQSSHPPQEVRLAQFSLYVHKGGLKPDSFHFISFHLNVSCLLGACMVWHFVCLQPRFYSDPALSERQTSVHLCACPKTNELIPWQFPLRPIVLKDIIVFLTAVKKKLLLFIVRGCRTALVE